MDEFQEPESTMEEANIEAIADEETTEADAPAAETTDSGEAAAETVDGAVAQDSDEVAEEPVAAAAE